MAQEHVQDRIRQHARITGNGASFDALSVPIGKDLLEDPVLGGLARRLDDISRTASTSLDGVSRSIDEPTVDEVTEARAFPQKPGLGQDSQGREREK